MLGVDRDAVICDLAETYGIFDYRALPVNLLATLVVGLRDDSRIKMKIGNVMARQDSLLIAAAVDRLSLLVYGMSKDSAYGRNAPKMIVPILTRTEQAKNNSDVQTYDSGDAFEAAWKKATGGVTNGD